MTLTKPLTSRRAGVLHVPQGRGLFQRLTVEQNLVLGATGSRRERAVAVRDASMRIPELRGWLNRRVDTLSGGEQALVALGRMLAGRPRYALVDELALGLAPITADRLDTELARLRSDGVGILLVEQYAPRALALADRVVILERGTVTYDGDPAGAGSAESLVSSYLGAPQ
jgi:branched-chain amino acid transport system ATP-binding protein